MSQVKNNKKVIFGGIALVALIAILAVAYVFTRPDTTKGAKHIQVEVISADETSKTFDIDTDEEYLGAALKAEKLVDGAESETGMFITTVDGYTASDDNKEWWKISKDGTDLMTGADSTPIEDGEHYEFTLVVGY